MQHVSIDYNVNEVEPQSPYVIIDILVDKRTPTSVLIPFQTIRDEKRSNFK